MLHLIAYDIACGVRLRKVAAICEDFGTRVEKSVFECDLNDKDFARMWERLSSTISPDEDSILDYPIGLIDSKRIRTLGRKVRCERPTTYIF